MTIEKILHRTILAGFYILFLFLPLIFFGSTSELFEFNKMWFVFGMTTIIGAAWFTKMIFQRQLRIQRTPIDIPILLFLLSQIISTIFSLDSHVSFWGYYSRFNGGLLSTITYFFLYYAMVSNTNRKDIIRFLQVSLFSGLLTTLWALPSHFGYDPTCYVFRGNFDVSCWTDAFQPKVRIFGTLGQPDWLAAHLVILIPIALAFGINAIRKQKLPAAIYYLLLTLLFYIDLLYTRARSGFVGMVVALLLFVAFYFLLEFKSQSKLVLTNFFIKYWYLLVLLVLIGIITFTVGTPLSQLDKFTLPGLTAPAASNPTSSAKPAQKSSTVSTGEIGGTDSGKIRLFVWRGALDIWLHHPLFGTGVETYAFAYYLFRPAGHNMTSEWDYLYNKAHNEYLNYLATTGIFGLGTYLLMVVWFLWSALTKITNFNTKNANLNLDNSRRSQTFQKPYNLQPTTYNLTLALLTSYIGILVVNFFGFSVVTVNLYLFLIPGFAFVLENMLKTNQALIFPQVTKATQETSPFQYLGTTIIAVAAIFILMTLFTFWDADTKYAYGMNLDHAGYYQQATPYLKKAVDERDDEPVFKDELSSNEGVLASSFAQQKDTANAQKFAQDAVNLSNNVTGNYPNNVVFWKTRVRIFYELSQFNSQYLTNALDAIQKAHTLAPTDAKISYNLGLLYGQTNQVTKAIDTLKNTIKLKPDYRDAYYALGLLYHQAATDEKGHVIKPDLQQKAVVVMQYILTHFSIDDKQASDALKGWGEK